MDARTGRLLVARFWTMGEADGLAKYEADNAEERRRRIRMTIAVTSG